MAFLGWFSKNNSQVENTITDEDAGRIVDEFNQSSNTIQEIPEVLENISFDEVIRYFKNHRQKNPSFGQAALICKEHSEGTFLAQVFLDENNNLICLSSGLPSGRQFVAKNMDKKLSEFLGDRDFNLVDLKPKSTVFKFIKIVGVILWIFVILLILLPLLGRSIMNQALAADLKSSPPLEITQNMVAFWPTQKAFDKARETAYVNAKKYAEKELDEWEKELVNRIDTDFLDWYFNYFNQKKQEVEVLAQYVGEIVIDPGNIDHVKINDNIKNRINKNINREFSRRVVNSKYAESKFRAIVIDTTEFYLEELSADLHNVPKMYKISQTDWDQYLETIKVRLENEQGDGILPVEIIGGYVTTKVVAKFAAKAGSKVAAGFVSSQVAALIDPAVAVVLLGLDYLDYINGVAQNKPRLREDLVQSLHQIKKTLLNDPESGVMSAVNELDEKIRNSI
ncbi:hypothetical protein [Lyngbya sp. CCY1209]|uniref:hypothetical protein n=1 Tax=Lyngbya sp. CCY1209 TaxID=2886103 RepID=UPI002D200F7A|nr:hypothetical protein [Lyngbya sp. CCY1209]MEB3883369.1 hypothetical protein [Lyngbya sp. CCY1209]